MDLLPGVSEQDKDTNSERDSYEKFPFVLSEMQEGNDH